MAWLEDELNCCARSCFSMSMNCISKAPDVALLTACMPAVCIADQPHKTDPCKLCTILQQSCWNNKKMGWR